MTRSRRRVFVLSTACAAAVALVGAALPTVAAAHPDGKGDQDNHTGNGNGEYSESFGVNVLGHADPGGFNADVVAHGRYAYLGSWGNAADPDEDGSYPFCRSKGVRVFDLQNPRNPKQSATFADAASEPELAGSWTEKVIVADVDSDAFTGTLAAVSIQNCQPDGARGWGVWDVTDPTDPQRLHYEETEPEVESRAGSHEIWLEVREDAGPYGDEAYVYTAEILREQRQSDPEEGHFEPDMQIWDVSAPEEPNNVGSWGVWQDEGIEPQSPDADGIQRARFVHSLTASDGIAYLSYWDRGTVMLDVSDPSSPELISSVDVPTEGLWSRGSMHSSWLAEGGDLLIEAPEVFDPTPQEGSDQEHAFGYPRFTDISDPSNPEPVGGFEMDTTREAPENLPTGFWTVHDPKVRTGMPGDDNLVYFSHYAEGVTVVDIDAAIEASDLDAGVVAGEDDALVAQFVPPPTEDPFAFFGPEGVEFPNVWGVFLHEDFKDRKPFQRYALASDINSGLWVFQLDSERPGGGR
ncbi:hypothetical protein [Haloechinothrix sp. LS1_15]|uniref:LVIVD repeat-containing protein n=1 Tax=Haloechinothrix sp. LS1_15 TaxID=2652248 RepID=UPI00294B276D|nr:hypothetical protein [Haloechinothrix sp. LS1_15]